MNFTLFPQIIFALYTNLWYYVSGRYSYLIIETVPFIHYHRINFTISLYIWAVLAHFSFYVQRHVRKLAALLHMSRAASRGKISPARLGANIV